MICCKTCLSIQTISNDAISLEFLENDRDVSARPFNSWNRLEFYINPGHSWARHGRPKWSQVNVSQRRWLSKPVCVCVSSLSQKNMLSLEAQAAYTRDHEGSQGITSVWGSQTVVHLFRSVMRRVGQKVHWPQAHPKMWRVSKEIKATRKTYLAEGCWRGLSGNPDIFSATLGNINRRWSMGKNSNRTSLTWWNHTLIEWSWGWVRICRICVAETLANDFQKPSGWLSFWVPFTWFKDVQTCKSSSHSWPFLRHDMANTSPCCSADHLWPDGSKGLEQRAVLVDAIYDDR